MQSLGMTAKLLSRTLPLCAALLFLGASPHLARAAASDTPVPDNRTILAEEVLELAYSPSSLRDSFASFLDPALDAMKRDGMPDAAREEVRKAFLQWFDEEVKWDDIKPKLVQIYAHDFTEPELATLLHFLQKPLGQEVMAKLPLVMHDGSVAGQDYFASKQASLNAKLAPIIAKYRGTQGNKSSGGGQ
jgi:hypothetical protein